MQAGVRSRRLEEGTSRARVELAVRVALVVFRLVGGTGVPRVAVGAGTAIAGLAAALRGVRRGRAAATLQRAQARLASRATERAAHLGGEVHEAALGGGPGREGDVVILVDAEGWMSTRFAATRVHGFQSSTVSARACSRGPVR